MARQKKAVADVPDIETPGSFMVCDKMADIEFGKNLTIYTVLLRWNNEQGANADYRFDTLIDFALDIRKTVTKP